MALGLSTGYILRFGVGSFTFFYDHWVGFMSAALSMSLFQGILWYTLSFQEGKLLALGGNSGNVIYDVCRVIVISSTLADVSLIVLHWTGAESDCWIARYKIFQRASPRYDSLAVDRHKHGLYTSHPSWGTHHGFYDSRPLLPRPIYHGWSLQRGWSLTRRAFVPAH